MNNFNNVMTLAKRYKSDDGCVYNIGYHLIWCTKYRKDVLKDAVARRIKELFNEKAEELGVEIASMEVMSDHVHLFVKSKPTYPPHFIVNQMKGYSSRVLRKEFPKVRSRIPCLWSRSYYCEPVGHISEETIIRYIENQYGK